MADNGLDEREGRTGVCSERDEIWRGQSPSDLEVAGTEMSDKAAGGDVWHTIHVH